MVQDVRAEEFGPKVLEASERKAVVVDFWAPWCAPCHMLAPVVEKVVGELEPYAELVKVNVDENPELASRYGIRGIPAVKIFRKGQVVDEFVGVLPEPEIRRILRRHVTTRSDELVTAAETMAAEGRREQAMALLEEALQEEPDHPPALLALARLQIAAGNREEARRLLQRIPRVADEWKEAEKLLARLSLEQGAESEEDPGQLENRAEAGNSAELWYRAGCLRAGRGEYREALEDLLRSVETSPHWNDDAARKKMLEIFQVVGIRSPLADEYRDKLQMLLY